MKTSELIELLQEILEADGDNEVFLEIGELDYFPEVYDASTFETNRYDDFQTKCLIHGMKKV